jgi:hypothetical protein
MKFKNKRGLESSTLVTLIALIIGFGILLIAARNLTSEFPSSITKETCHSSVLARGYEASGVALGKLFTNSIKCKTEYKCLSMGGECPTGYQTITVFNEEDIKREVANSMYDCWWELGEGKVNFLGRPLITNEKSCAMCSVIHFDEKIRQQFPKISSFSDYLYQNNVPGTSQTFLQYFSGSRAPPTEKIDFSTNQDYSVVYSLIEKNLLWTTVGTSAGCTASFLGGAKLAAASLAIPVAGVYVAPVAFGTVFLGGCAASFFTADKFNNWMKSDEKYISSMQLVPYTPESVKQLGCQSIESIP